MAILENQDPTEPHLDPDNGSAMSRAGRQLDQKDDTKPDGFSDGDVVSFLNESNRLSKTYQQMVAMAEWERSQLAYRSEHSGSSKYFKDQYKNRAKYFVPKTRNAVRKNLTATASALFSNRDVIAVGAENEGDPKERANAALLKQMINHRFNSKTVKIGVPWFQIAIGARLNTQLMGAVASKQTWKYVCRDKEVTEKREEPVLINGDPALDSETGEPMMQVIETKKTVKDVLIDRPEITLLPNEHVRLDPGADWLNPAQSSPVLILIWPMHIDDVKAMTNEEKNLTPWRAVTDEQLRAALYSETEVMGVKAAREGSASSTATRSSQGGQLKGNRNEIVEARECFFRRDGVDYHCWELKGLCLLSDVVPVEEVYPAMRGARPVIIGTDALEPHVLYPQAPVASWRQAQDEINDFSNLRMDATRQSVYPTAKVKAGKNIDYKAVQRRDGQGVILVREMDDVEWDRPPGPPANVHEEVNLLSNHFDELAGNFSQSSVQTNRQLNETVGGMQIISANANATSSFDLICWVKTWVEPVLTQVVALEQYYEDDANLIAIAGKRAKLYEKFGVDEVTDELLESQVNLTVSVGIGSADPMQKLMKFKTSFDLAMPFIELGLKEGKVKLNYEEILGEIYGTAGYDDVSRFIEVDQNGQGPGMDPEKMQQLGQMMDQLKQENQQLNLKLTNKSDEIQAKTQSDMVELAAEHTARQQEARQAQEFEWKSRLLEFLEHTMDTQTAAGQQTNTSQVDAQIQSMLGLMGYVKDVHATQTNAMHDMRAAALNHLASIHATNTQADTAKSVAQLKARTTAPVMGV